MRGAGPYREPQECRANTPGPAPRRQPCIRTARRTWPPSASGICGSRPLRHGGPPRPAAPGAAMGRSRPAGFPAGAAARPAGPEEAAMAITEARFLLSTPAPLACSTNPDLFFAESPLDVARAKQLCAEGPVRAACLAEAAERAEPWGVWGGELFLRGVIVPTKRARGRPRKSSLAA